ncbi:MAG: GNAT family N-acetyltransferase [Synergistaceae bacterium]|nr:GNAT family N-acetyltransferase [Synergistaceae bacterium]
MDRLQAFYENFFSFAAMLGGAPGGATLSFAPPSLAAASGQPYAGENYAIFGAEAKQGDVAAALAFFSERRADFVVPWLPHTPYSLARVFEESGLARRRIYTMMYLPFENMQHGSLPEGFTAVTDRRASEWGEAAWYAFGGESGADAASYREFGAYLATRPENRAYALELDGRFVSTALIHESANAAGLYYFATLPEYRRKGLARRLMEGLCVELTRGGKPLVLLATEAGLPFYINFGFKVIDKAPICSLTEDI